MGMTKEMYRKFACSVCLVLLLLLSSSPARGATLIGIGQTKSAAGPATFQFTHPNYNNSAGNANYTFRVHSCKKVLDLACAAMNMGFYSLDMTLEVYWGGQLIVTQKKPSCVWNCPGSIDANFYALPGATYSLKVSSSCGMCAWPQYYVTLKPKDLCDTCSNDYPCDFIGGKCLQWDGAGDKFCGKQCGSNAGCPPGFSCMSGTTPKQCVPTSQDCSNITMPCIPDCANKYCGSNGCGGTCGDCDGNCVNGQCEEPTNFCSDKISGNYCSGDKLIVCLGKQISQQFICNYGCKQNPPGTNDVCNPAPGQGVQCDDCATDSNCKTGYKCLNWTSYPDIHWCAKKCTSDSQCQANHKCSSNTGACAPDWYSKCVGNKVYTYDYCGNQLAYKKTCAASQDCTNGECVKNCSNACILSGQKQCVGSSSYQVCGNFDDDSCFEWGSTKSCGSGEKCEGSGKCTPVSGTGGQCDDCDDASDCESGYKCLNWKNYPEINWCAKPCTSDSQCPDNHECSNITDACKPSWYSKCVGNEIYKYDYCGNEIKYVKTCGANQACSSGQCVDQCSNDCDTLGEKLCIGVSSYLVCGNYDADPCNDLSSTKSCDAGQQCQGEGECSGVLGACQLCETGSDCQAGHWCASYQDSPDVPSFCMPKPCDSDDDCPGELECYIYPDGNDSTCWVSFQQNICLGNEVWKEDTCGILYKKAKTCAPDELCVSGTCEPLATCGDGECNGSEDCDDCPADCGACIGQGDCCEPHESKGCDNSAVQTCVCDKDPYCCQAEWDDVCVDEVDSEGCGQCEDCSPSCTGKECGDDGCGGTCGSCPYGEKCSAAGDCVCSPKCTGKECGDDGCGGSCGSCPYGEKCSAGDCVCSPKCTGKECGSDGCGGICGSCPSSQDCGPDGQCSCSPDCGGKECGNDGCGGSCGTCSAGHTCISGECIGLCNNGTCEPGETSCNCPLDCGDPCEGKKCGDNGCGKSCGACDAGSTCYNGECISLCNNGTCEPGETSCDCPQDCGNPCAGKKCGDDGCGGACGTCQAEHACSSKGLCVDESGQEQDPSNSDNDKPEVGPAIEDESTNAGGCGATGRPGTSGAGFFLIFTMLFGLCLRPLTSRSVVPSQ